MTASEPSDPSKSVDPLFQWDDKYLAQLRSIAETDEIPSDLDWPSLREAIKVRIIDVVGSFSDKPSPLLHPAAREAAAIAMAKSEGEQRANGNANGEASTSTAAAAANALDNRFSSSSSSARADGSPSSGRHSRQGGRLSRNDDSDSSSSSSSSDEDEDRSHVNNGGVPGFGAASSSSSLNTTAADRSGYYPAKTAPPPDRHGSWGRRLTQAKQDEETSLCLRLLDGFEGSPPFTVQRLAELLLDAPRFVRSAPKFTASLLRLLSVTAGHDDFPPVEPGVAPGAVNTVMMTMGQNGESMGSAEANEVGAVVGAVELQRMTGPPSPMAEPIFSPIPFLQRGNQAADGEAAADLGEDVPALELGQGRATSQADGRGGSDVEAPPPVSLQTATSAPTSARSPPSPPPAAPLALGGSEASSSSMPSSSTGSTLHQPLGVPPGRVDELDEFGGNDEAAGSSAQPQQSGHAGEAGTADGHQYGRAVHPLSSTTTTQPESAKVEAMIVDDVGGSKGTSGAGQTKEEETKGAVRASQGGSVAGGRAGSDVAEEERTHKRLKSEELH